MNSPLTLTEKPGIERRHALRSIAAHMQSIWRALAKSLKTNAAHILQRIVGALQRILQPPGIKEKFVQRICSASPHYYPLRGNNFTPPFRLALAANVPA